MNLKKYEEIKPEERKYSCNSDEAKEKYKNFIVKMIKGLLQNR